MAADNIKINFDINTNALEEAIRGLSVADKRAAKLYAEMYRLGRIRMDQIPRQFQDIIRSVDRTTQNLSAGDRETVNLYRDLVQLGRVNLSDVPEQFRNLVGEVRQADQVTERFSDRLRRNMQRVSESMQNVGTSMMDVGKTMTMSVTTPIVAGFGYAVKKNMEFEKQLSSTAAISAATAKEMKQLKEQALQLGKDTKYSALEVAQGQEELLKAGRNLNQVFSEMDDVLSLATAGDLELSRAAEIGSNTMNMFAKQGIKMSQVADLMAGAANASAIDVSEFYTSLSYVGPVAASLKISLEDLSAMIGVLGNNAIKGDKAGTGLRQFLMHLQPASDKAAADMQKLGLITKDGANQFYTASGKLKSLKDIINILRNSMKGLTDQQRQEKLKNIFGLIASPTVNTLLNANANAMDEMATAIKKVGAEEVAEKRMNNFAGTIERVQGSIETFAIKVGDMLAPTLRVFADNLDSVLGFVMELPKPFLQWGTIIALVVAAIGPLLVIVGALVSAIGTIGAAIAGISAPILIAIGVIGALISGIITLIATNKSFRDTVINVLNIVKDKFMQLKSIFIQVFNNLKILMLPVFEELKKSFQNFDMKAIIESFKILYESLKPLFPALKVIAAAIGVYIVGNIVSAIAILAGFISSIDNVIAAFISLGAFWRNFFNIFYGLFTLNFDLIKQSLIGLKDSFISIWKNLITSVTDFVGSFVKIIISFFRGLYNVLVGHSIIPDMAKSIIKWFQIMYTSTISKAKSIVSGVSNVFNILKSTTTKIISSIYTYLSSRFNSIRNVISTRMSSASNAVSSSLSRIRNIFSSVFNSIRGIVSNSISYVVSKLNSISTKINSIKSKIPSIKIPGFATGTNYAGGGLSLVGEKGPELINLPRGSQVFNNNKTNNIMSNSNKSVAINYYSNPNISEKNNFMSMLRNAGVY